jgi:hypothetical protein
MVGDELPLTTPLARKTHPKTELTLSSEAQQNQKPGKTGKSDT